MSKQSARKRRKPTRVDKEVYAKFGMKGKFKLSDLMGDYETIDFNNEVDAQTERVDPVAAARTIDLLMKHQKTDKFGMTTYNVPTDEWKAAVSDREKDLVDQGQMMAFTTDEMDLSEHEISESSDSDNALSTKAPQRVDWARYKSTDLAGMPVVAFCGTLSYDSEANMTLETMVGKCKSPDQWKTYMSSRVGAIFRSAVELPDRHTVVHFSLHKLFFALYLDARGELANYFYLKAVEM